MLCEIPRAALKGRARAFVTRVARQLLTCWGALVAACYNVAQLTGGEGRHRALCSCPHGRTFRTWPARKPRVTSKEEDCDAAAARASAASPCTCAASGSKLDTL